MEGDLDTSEEINNRLSKQDAQLFAQASGKGKRAEHHKCAEIFTHEHKMNSENGDDSGHYPVACRHVPAEPMVKQ